MIDIKVNRMYPIKPNQIYPFEFMNVGEMFEIKGSGKEVKKVRTYAYLAGKKFNMTFSIRKISIGVFGCWRIA